jgi:hypothetical protein
MWSFRGAGFACEPGLKKLVPDAEEHDRTDSQLAWLISITAISVLSWSGAASDLLKSFGCGMGHSVGCRATMMPALAARPIAS